MSRNNLKDNGVLSARGGGLAMMLKDNESSLMK